MTPSIPRIGTVRDALLLVTVCAVAACAPSTVRTPRPVQVGSASSTSAPERSGSAGPSADGVRPLTPREHEVITALLSQTEALRELAFAREVPVEVHDEARITSRLVEQLEEEDLEEARLVYGALGLIDPEMDLEALLGRLVAEQVIGYYDPEENRLVIREDVMRRLRRAHTANLDESRMVLVHELVHALQSHHLGLREAHDQDRDSDADNAYRAVVEGDATLAMVGYAATLGGGHLANVTANPELLRSAILGSDALPGAELGAAPPIVRVTMVGAYLYGLVFAAELHRRGGWEAVDAAHRHPPVSTEQVLHPRAYLRGEQPDRLELPELGELAQAGLESVVEDTLGELEMGVYFGQGTGADADDRAAKGWSGDRLRAYRGPDGAAVVWVTSWDDEREAREAEEAARRVLEAIAPPERPRHRVARRGRAVLIVRGLDPSLHDRVVAPFAALAARLPATPPVTPPARAESPENTHVRAAPGLTPRGRRR